ncbi:MAG: hypothetical protein EBV10_02390 [Synechococcaceae bacterium WB6_1A_059]|nr:hypothetical protein [Synechococcaceae bacterium WB6_1A_059]
MAIQSIRSEILTDFASSLTFTSAFGYIVSGGVLQGPKPIGGTTLHLDGTRLNTATTSTQLLTIQDDYPYGQFISYPGLRGVRKRVYVRNQGSTPIYVGTPTYTERFAKAQPNYNAFLPPPWTIEAGDYRLFYLSYEADSSGLADEVVLFPTPYADTPFARLNARVNITSDAAVRISPSEYSTSTTLPGENSVIKYQLSADLFGSFIENYNYDFTATIQGHKSWTIDDIQPDSITLRFDGWLTNDIEGVYVSTLTITTPSLSISAVNTATHSPSVNTISSDFFSKSYWNNPKFKNWGLLSSTLGYNPTANWGDGGISEVPGSIQLAATGQGVDVVIVDTGDVEPSHPEFALFSDGTGGSRVQNFNWYSLAAEVGDTGRIGLTYTPTYVRGDSRHEHSQHVAGIAAGNSQGWANKSLVYSMDIDQFSGTAGMVFKYLAAAHRLKKNSGNTRPTVANCSFATNVTNVSWSSIKEIVYQGQTFKPQEYGSSTFTATTLAQAGIFLKDGINLVIHYQSANRSAWLAAIQECINEGVVVVASAMNESSYIARSTADVNYNNIVRIHDGNGTPAGIVELPGVYPAGSGSYSTPNLILYYRDNGGYYQYISGSYVSKTSAELRTLYPGMFIEYWYNRGPLPATVDGVICVGAIRAAVDGIGVDGLANFSNRGPRIDIFAPGAYVQSAWTSSTGITINGFAYDTPVRDPRSAGSHYFMKFSGTSMAAPQVTGIAALLLERDPTLNSTSTLLALIESASISRIPISNGGISDLHDLMGAPNRYLQVPKIIQTERAAWTSSFSLPDAVVGLRIDYVKGRRILTLGVGSGGDAMPMLKDRDPDWWSPEYLKPKAGRGKYAYFQWRSVYEIPLSDTPTNKTYYSDSTLADGTYLYKKKTTLVDNKDYSWYFGHYEGEHSLFQVQEDFSGNVYISICSLRETSGDTTLDGTLDRLQRVFYYHSKVDQDAGYRTAANQLGPRLDDFGNPNSLGLNTLFFLGFDARDRVITSLRPLP